MLSAGAPLALLGVGVAGQTLTPLLEPSRAPIPGAMAGRAQAVTAATALPTYLEESTDLGELGLGSKEAEGQDWANVLRYGVEMGDEAIRHLLGQQG